MRKKKVRWIVLLSLCAVLAVWIVWSNVTVGATYYTVASDRLPAAFDGYRIAVISDLHNAEFGENNSTLISLVEQEAPDIIAFTGDLIDTGSDHDVAIAEALVRELAKIAPCYYVTGNHEARVPGPYHELEQDLLSMGVIVLHDSAERLVRDGETLQIAGLDDPNFTDRDTSLHEAILRSKLQDMGLTGDYCVLLTHRPETIEAYKSEDIDLVLSGHTHGGQFRLPFLGGIAAPNQPGLFPKYDAGRFDEGNTTMIVSRGVGNSSIPFRINNRPEVVVVDLVRSEDSG